MSERTFLCSRKMLGGLCAAMLSLGASADQPAGAVPPVLTHNPFERKQSTTHRNGMARRTAAGADAHPALRATLVAGRQSMANLGGKVMQLGEEFQGYMLVAVEEESATFQREGRRVEIELDAGDKDAGNEQ